MQTNGTTNGHDDVTALIEQKDQIIRLQGEIFRERIAELEFAAEDIGWRELSAVGNSTFEFTRTKLRSICQLSRVMFLKNPLVNRAVTIQAVYVFGQGVKITARDPDIQEIVDDFMEDEGNQAELTSHQARVLKECDLQTEGNIFFSFFTDIRTGKVRIRSVPVDEIDSIVHNPDDKREPWFYKRVHSSTTLEQQLGMAVGRDQITYYPDWNFNTKNKRFPNPGNGARLVRDVPMFHMRVGGLSQMQFGIPETYQSLDWARAYKDFLTDWATIVRSLSRFAWKMTTPNDPRAVSAMQSLLGSTLGVGGTETNPAPAAGSVFVESEDFNMQPLKVSGATVSAEDGRRLLLMACAALGVPETFMGDVSVGTLATAESLDRPTELKFRDRQTLWADALNDIVQFIIRQRAIAGEMGLTYERNESGKLVVMRGGQSVDTYVDVTFPPILERDITKVVGAIATAATLDGRLPPEPRIVADETVSRLMHSAIGAGDVDKLVRALYPDDNASVAG